MKKFLKSIYQVLPLIFILKIWRSIKTPRFYKYLTVKGKFNCPLPNGEKLRLTSKHDLYIEKEIFWNGIFSEFEPKTISLWMNLATQSNVVFDIGANTGIFGLVATKYKPSASIHFFEPAPYNSKILAQNISLNPEVNAHLNEIALSNSLGVATMHVKEDAINYTNSLEYNPFNENSIEIKVPTKTIDAYCEENKIEKIDLIKLDVEGHEFQVLEGAKNQLKHSKPSIIIEVLNSEFGKRLFDVIKAIDGYKFYRIDDKNNSLTQCQDFSTEQRTNFLISIEEYA